MHSLLGAVFGMLIAGSKALLTGALAGIAAGTTVGVLAVQLMHNCV